MTVAYDVIAEHVFDVEHAPLNSLARPRSRMPMSTPAKISSNKSAAYQTNNSMSTTQAATPVAGRGFSLPHLTISGYARGVQNFSDLNHLVLANFDLQRYLIQPLVFAIPADTT